MGNNVELRKCPSCDTYTMGAECPKDSKPTKTAHPPRFTIQDKWARFRRKEKYPVFSG